MALPTAADYCLGLSMALTGCNKETLAPGFDPVDLKSTYAKVMQERNPTGFLALLRIAQEVWPDPNVDPTLYQLEEIASRCMAEQPTASAQLIQLWYLGVWYKDSSPSAFADVISDQAYINGIAWKTAQAHAMGYAESGGPYWGYGYWNSKPPTLEDYTGVKGGQPETNPTPNSAPEGE